MAINEDEFLRALFKKIRNDPTVVVPPGDDCAAISVEAKTCWPSTRPLSPVKVCGPQDSVTQSSTNKRCDQLLLATTDQLSEDIHYWSQHTTNPTPGKLAGRKLLARCVSDIAAMGGIPRYALASISVGPGYDNEWLEQFTEGMLALAQELDINIIGGDLAAAKANVASLTLLGWVLREKLCLRKNALDKDLIFVTGQFGASLPTEKHLRFSPRLDEAQWLSEHGYTRAMIDISDGLLKDLTRMCRSSNLTAILSDASIPRTKLGDQNVSLTCAYLDGEDYELLFAVPAKKGDQLQAKWPFSTPVSKIGRFVSPVETPSVFNKEGVDLIDHYGQGFDHFT